MTGAHVLGIVISVTGTLMAVDQVRDLDRGLRSRGWLSTQGPILGSVILAGLLIWYGLHLFYGAAG